MKLSDKIKTHRQRIGLSQEQLAEKLCVSRQAVTKWETSLGTPDIQNLQNLASIFGCSVDSLLSDNDIFDTEMKEMIDIQNYKKANKRQSIFDVIVKDKFHDAVIVPLIRQKKLHRLEWWLDFFVSPGFLQMTDSLTHYTSRYYLVNLKQKQLFVKVTKTMIEYREIVWNENEKKKIIDETYYYKTKQPMESTSDPAV